MKSNAWKKGLALVASVWMGGANAELVTDRVGVCLTPTSANARS